MYPAFMLTRNAALRDSEIKTLTWGRVNLKAKILQVGKSKSDAGEGRIIPLNSDLFDALAEHVPGVRRGSRRFDRSGISFRGASLRPRIQPGM